MSRYLCPKAVPSHMFLRMRCRGKMAGACVRVCVRAVALTKFTHRLVSRFGLWAWSQPWLPTEWNSAWGIMLSHTEAECNRKQRLEHYNTLALVNVRSLFPLCNGTLMKYCGVGFGDARRRSWTTILLQKSKPKALLLISKDIKLSLDIGGIDGCQCWEHIQL